MYDKNTHRLHAGKDSRRPKRWRSVAAISSAVKCMKEQDLELRKLAKQKQACKGSRGSEQGGDIHNMMCKPEQNSKSFVPLFQAFRRMMPKVHTTITPFKGSLKLKPPMSSEHARPLLPPNPASLPPPLAQPSPPFPCRDSNNPLPHRPKYITLS